MVIREPFGREAEGLGCTQLLALGGKSGWLQECGVFILACYRILHGRELPHHCLRNREATPNAVNMQVKRQIPKAQKVREETVKDAERWNLLDHRFQDSSTCRRHLGVHEDHTRSMTFMRCTGEGDEQAEGTGSHVGAIVVAFLDMPDITPFTPSLRRSGFKATGTSPVTATGPEQMPLEPICVRRGHDNHPFLRVVGRLAAAAGVLLSAWINAGVTSRMNRCVEVFKSMAP